VAGGLPHSLLRIRTWVDTCSARFKIVGENTAASIYRPHVQKSIFLALDIFPASMFVATVQFNTMNVRNDNTAEQYGPRFVSNMMSTLLCPAPNRQGH